MQKIIAIFFLLFTVTATAQTVVRGTVYDDATRQPLAFVSVGVQGEPQGTTTDIEGRFKLEVKQLPAKLVLSYVGYQGKNIDVADDKQLIILLAKKELLIKEVIVKAGPNPAIPIIKKVYENKDLNDPAKLSSYTYTTYNKLILTADIDSVSKLDNDTSAEKLIKFFERSHLFLIETVTQKKFKAPNLVNEYVLGVRASGIKDPSFMALATQLQSFTFYNTLIELGDKAYLNPISNNSENKYLFTLEDTLYEGVDSVFIISFQPRYGKNFDALKGVLYINTNGYAIQNVIAIPVEQDNLGIKIQQKYERIDGKRWFPVQLNTDILFKNAQVNQANIIGIGRTYLKDIKIDPPLKRSDFLQIELTVEPFATERKDTFWVNNRPDSLDTREQNTYTVVDSIGKAQNFDKKIRSFIALSEGRIPVRSIDIDINRTIAYNRYEGFRLGMGLHTNSRFSRVFKTGGFFAYGFKDRQFKWSVDASTRIHRRADMWLTTQWTHDTWEAGRPEMHGFLIAPYGQRLRNSLVDKMDLIDRGEVQLSFRTPGYLQFFAFANRTHAKAQYNYFFVENPTTEPLGTREYTFAEAGINVRFAYKEKMFDTGKVLASLGTKAPVLWVQYTRGFTGILDGQYAFNKIDLKLEKSFNIKSLGRTSMSLWAGYVDRPVPYYLNYTNRANRAKNSFLTSVYSFETMHMNEFLSSTYASLFFRHNFQSLLFKGKKFRPKFVIVTNAGWGMLRKPEYHTKLAFKTMEKGFFESGLIIDDIIRINGITGIGVGGFYRYGAYSLPKTTDNLAVKLSLNLSF